MSYGLITRMDADMLEESLLVAARLASGRGERLRVLEIGICHGDTARGMRDFLAREGVKFCYVGVDSERDRPIALPFPEADVVLGPSDEVYPSVAALASPLHFVFQDGCHCVNHVMLDFLHYGDLVVPGGRLLMHDAAPYTQNKLDYQGHGPRGHVDFGTSTREAARKLGLLAGRRSDWRLVKEAWEPAWDSGGVFVFERL